MNFTSKKQGSKNEQPRQKLVTWSEVVRVLPDDESRSYATRALREAGFSADSFGSSKKAREIVCEAIVALEDGWEMARAPKAVRQAAKVVRRRLELELWT